MKSHPFRASSILAVLSLLVALGVSGTAQQPTTRQQPTDQQQERPIPELSPQESNPEALRIALPPACKGLNPDIQIHGNPQGSPVTLSPTLTTFLGNHNVTPKGYGDPRIDTVFADSFKLKSCRVCWATIEFQVKHRSSDVYFSGAANFSNDTITVGVTGFTQRFLNGLQIWTGTNPNPKQFGPFALLPISTLNTYIWTGPGTPPPYLDIVAQDDTEIVSTKLTVWYY